MSMPRLAGPGNFFLDRWSIRYRWPQVRFLLEGAVTVENVPKTFINVAVHFALLIAGFVAALATASGASAQSLEIRTGDAGCPRDV